MEDATVVRFESDSLPYHKEIRFDASDQKRTRFFESLAEQRQRVSWWQNKGGEEKVESNRAFNLFINSLHDTMRDYEEELGTMLNDVSRSQTAKDKEE